MNLSEIINIKVNELSKIHADIIENECKKVCEKFKVSPSDLIIECHGNSEINIKIQASSFGITNNFTIDYVAINNEF